MPETPAPVPIAKIQPFGMPALEVIDFNADKFQQGVDLQFFAPGDLAPFGGARLQRGALLLVVPPNVADQIRALKPQPTTPVANGGMPA